MSSSKHQLSVGMSGYDVSSLHNILRLFGFDISEEEIKKNLFGDSTEKAIKQFQFENHLDKTGVLDQSTKTSLFDSAKEKGFFSVRGIVVTRSGVAAKELQVIAIDKNQGKDSLLGKTITDDNGNYVILYKRENFVRNGKQNADIEIKIVDQDDETKIYGISSVHFNADHDKRINIVLNYIDKLPGKRSEFSQIINDLNAYTLNNSFRDLKEDKDRQDISYLSNKTGWDARLIAMVSLSDKYFHESKIEPSFYYALFRSGLSTNADELYKTNPDIVHKIWNKAIKDLIIDQSLESNIDRNIELYREYQKSYLLENMKPAGVSSLKEVLSISLQEDEEKQKQFIDLYFNNSDNIGEFWTKVENQFGADTMKKLQLDSKLAYITMNNPNLIKKLESLPSKIKDPADLIKEGLYKKDRWYDLFADVELSIPKEISGQNEQEKKENYVNHMTLLLKKSYPTLVVSDMIKTDELKVNDPSVKNEICNSLNKMYEKLEFHIGTQPIEKVLKDNPTIIKIGDKALKEIRKIERVYQLTPSDETMKVLWTNNLTSALSIMQYDKNEFIKTFGENLGGEEITSSIYSKAHQVHSTVLNLATACMTYKVNPKIYAISQIAEEDSDQSPIIDNPTLEELFDGSLDYCECEHCQSVLSPSSYLVDLLQFINLKKFDSDGNEILPRTYDKENPLDVLLKKRPDLEHIQLTCENTNTVLPYIDLVNEILEYFVVNHNLDGFKGFNIQDIATIELLANPQFVNERAYTILKDQVVYPFNLPFNRSLEYLRLLFNHLKIELNVVMEKLRINDNLDVSNSNRPEPYAWREIYNEFLGISPQEYHQILTNSLVRNLPAYFGEDETMSFNEFRDKLSNAKVFSQKTNITYKELIELVSTKFINPDSYLIPKLQKLTVSFADIKALEDGAISPEKFKEKIPPDINEQEYGGDILQWVHDNHNKIMNHILLTSPNSEEDVKCERFDKLELRYSLPDSTNNLPKEIDFWCLFRFIRLWKKLGWTIEETDKVITALYNKDNLPKEDTNNNIDIQKQKLDNGVKDLIIKVAHMKKIMKKLSLKSSKLIELLSLWSDIDVQGKNSLYNKMFLNSSISDIDNVFNENGSGEYLQDQNKKIGGYLAILQAAFNLNMKNISLILTDAGLNEDSVLSLENVSKIYRYSFLARCLQLSVEELILIKQLSGKDPFNKLENVNPEILEFIDIVKLINKSEFKTDTLNYYLLHQDSTGKASPSSDELLSLVKTIKDGLIRIEQENTVDDDPNGEVVKEKMALVYENSVVDRFFGFLKIVRQYSEKYDHPTEELEQVIIDTSNKSLEYDDSAELLNFHGVMGETMRNDLKDLSIVNSEFKKAIDNLYEKGQADLVSFETDFFEKFPELKEPYVEYVTSSGQSENDKMKIILKGFMPGVKKKLKQLFVKQTLCSSLDVDLLMVNQLLENHIILHAYQDENEPLIEDFLSTEASGTSVNYWFGDDIPPLVEPDIAEPFSGNINFNEGDLPGQGKISAIWEFFVEAPINENFHFYVETDPDAKVEISIDEKRLEMVDEITSNGVWSLKEPILLQSGNLYKIKLQITNVKDKAILKWKSKGIGKVVIPIKYLYPHKLVQNFQNSYTRLLKSIGIIQRLAIREKEVSFFSTKEEYQIDKKGLLNSIAVNPKPPKDKPIELFKKLIDLLKYVSLKESLNIRDGILTSIFENPVAVDENGEQIILTATKWDKFFLVSILDRFKWTQAEIELSKFLRINEAFEIIKKFGVKVDSLFTWTTNDPSPTTNDPSRNTINEIKNMLRSKYDESAWFNALQQINDLLRKSQRDALVSYILNEMQKNDTTKKINTPDKLFEYFLIDVQMDPCMKTSRIKQAISTTQLFIQRCLMNLEPSVAPSSIKKNQWEWIQRYRVAEANEKLFLYPENWLEPELRDLKSPFFKELEEELLQEDLNDELAETIMLNYLEKLDDVSKLEICATYLEENGSGNKADDVLHVFGRTSSGAAHKYYHRRLIYGYWTAWVPIIAEIEDNPILPVVWKNRLFLFWLNIVTKGNNQNILPTNQDLVTLTTSDLNNAVIKSQLVEANLSWIEYYNNKWQPRKTSDFKNPIVLTDILTDRQARTDRHKIGMNSKILLNLEQKIIEGSLEISVFYPQIGWITVTNPPSTMPPTPTRDKGFVLNDTKNTLTNDNGHRYGDYPKRFITREVDDGEDLSFDYEIVAGGNRRKDIIIAPKHLADVVTIDNHHPVRNPIEVPFFYQDRKHIFLVKPEQEDLVPVPNFDHVFTNRSFLGQDKMMEHITIPDLWEKPQIVKSLSTSIDGPMISRVIIDSRSEDSKPIDFYNKDNPLNKVLPDNKPILYDGVAIGPLGSTYATLLYNNRIDTDDEFESAGRRGDT